MRSILNDHSFGQVNLVSISQTVHSTTKNTQIQHRNGDADMGAIEENSQLEV
jgi:hypothetical protein